MPPPSFANLILNSLRKFARCTHQPLVERPDGDSDEDIVVRIKADAPVLKPDEPVPAQPVL
jgi:hypothetical protein